MVEKWGPGRGRTKIVVRLVRPGFPAGLAAPCQILFDCAVTELLKSGTLDP